MGALEGKVAIVTGAGRGLGRAHAHLLAQLGAKVVVNDLGGEWDGTGADARPAQQVANEIRSAGGDAVPNFGDVAAMDDAKALINQALETYGRLDILVNNAGILRDRMSFTMEEADWDKVVAVNMKGHFATTRFATAYWRDRFKRTGKPVDAVLIFTSSEAGLYGNAGQINYAAAKAGVAAMMIVTARELARYGVRTFGICPRARTRLTENTFGELRAEGAFDIWAPENVSPLIAYLCSDGSRGLTGQMFVAGGGKVILMQGWTVAAELKQDHRWTLEQLSVAIPRLFSQREKGPAPLPADLQAPN